MGIFKSKSKQVIENTATDYRKNKLKYVLILGVWVKTALKTKQKFASVDIFQFDKKLNNPNQWFEIGLFLYDCLLFLLDGTDLDSFLSVPLPYSDKSTNIEDVNFSSIKELVFTEEPPSLNLYPLVNNAFEKQQGIFIKTLSNELGKSVYFEEDRLDNGMYMSRIVIRSNN